jgi:serine/threonine-protein phosphatase CPPED1
MFAACLAQTTGDLVHMEALIYAGTTDTWKKDRQETWTVEQCYAIQERQQRDFQTVWNDLNDNIALVCLCGNHDVGNRPTRTSIERFRRAFGDDRLAFWAKRRRQCYNVVLNTSLFNDPSGALDLYKQQLEWMEERFQYAVDNQATHIFVFGHHPWFLYREDEDEKAGDLPGVLTVADDKHVKSGQVVADDAYFVIPLERRRQVLDMFQKYKVTAAFAGHFHQNLVTRTTFGMEMITTSALSVVLQSTGIPRDFNEPQTRGLRRVNVHSQPGKFDHEFISL